VGLAEQVHASPRYKENLVKMKAEFDAHRARHSAADLIESMLPAGS